MIKLVKKAAFRIKNAVCSLKTAVAGTATTVATTGTALASDPVLTIPEIDLNILFSAGDKVFAALVVMSAVFLGIRLWKKL